MSADALRTAAEVMRAEWVGTPQEEFYDAVAEWLDTEARWVDIGANNSPEPAALAVARAYLGTS